MRLHARPLKHPLLTRTPCAPAPPRRRGWPPGEEPRYDVDHVLVVCRMHGFREGLLLLYEVGGCVSG